MFFLRFSTFIVVCLLFFVAIEGFDQPVWIRVTAAGLALVTLVVGEQLVNAGMI